MSGSYDAQDRILTYGTTTYSHDRDGFRTEKVVGTDTTRYVYDALGNLLRVTLPDATAIEYVVDGESRRVGRKVNGVLQQGWLWQSDLAPAAELDGSGAVLSRFVYGTRPNVPDYLVRGGGTYRLVLDQLGSVRLVVNTADGTVAQRIDYDEFGRITQNTNPGFQPFGFAGGLYDDQTGLARFGARDYDPVTGQWTAKEPLGFAGGDANLYAYVGNDPVSAVDPTGEFSISPATAGFIGGCALSAALESVVKQALGPSNCVELGQVTLEALKGAGFCALLGGLGWAGKQVFQGFRAAAGGARFIVSPTGTVVEKAIADQWARGTFPNVVRSIEHHFSKHGAGRTLQQYTDDAVRFFQQFKSQAKWGKWKENWQPSYRLKVGDQRGYYTILGRILTYWD